MREPLVRKVSAPQALGFIPTSPPIPVGWVSVSIDHDTGTFAVNSIRSWWHRLGRTRYPDAVIVQLISATTTTGTGLTVHREVDQNRYPKGFTISDPEMATINITRADFHVTGTKQYPPRDRALAHLFSNRPFR